MTLGTTPRAIREATGSSVGIHKASLVVEVVPEVNFSVDPCGFLMETFPPVIPSEDNKEIETEIETTLSVCFLPFKHVAVQLTLTATSYTTPQIITLPSSSSPCL